MKSMLAFMLGWTLAFGINTEVAWFKVFTGSFGLLCIWLWHKVDKAEAAIDAARASTDRSEG